MTPHPPPVIEGQRLIHNGEVLVTVSGRLLDPARSQQVRNCSPTGFDWGYPGSGPAQLALALLLDAGLPEPIADRHHQAFKWEVVASLDSAHFRMPAAVVQNWIRTFVLPAEAAAPA